MQYPDFHHHLVVPPAWLHFLNKRNKPKNRAGFNQPCCHTIFYDKSSGIGKDWFRVHVKGTTYYPTCQYR